MKKFLTIAAAVATSAVLITSVFAETAPMTATYDAESGKVILTDAPTDLATTTYIVFDRENQDGVASGTVAEGLIKQIDQKENTTVTEIYVGPLADGKYQVRLGGDGSVRDALFTVASATPTPTPTVEPTATPTPTPTSDRLIGDVVKDGKIRPNDIAAIIAHYLETSTLEDDDLIAADTVDDGKIRPNDIAEIIAAYLETKEDTVVGNSTIDTKQFTDIN